MRGAAGCPRGGGRGGGGLSLLEVRPQLRVDVRLGDGALWVVVTASWAGEEKVVGMR
jgi:hypothetical protein